MVAKTGDLHLRMSHAYQVSYSSVDLFEMCILLFCDCVLSTVLRIIVKLYKVCFDAFLLTISTQVDGTSQTMTIWLFP